MIDDTFEYSIFIKFGAKNKMLRKLLPFYFLLFTSISWTQKNDNIGFEAGYRSGFFVPHRASLDGITNKEILSGIELTGYIQTNGKNAYSRDFNHPRFGLSLVGTSLSNYNLFGYLFGGHVFAEVPLVRKNNHDFSTSIGIGLTYASKVYDKETNPRNVAISSHLNILFNLGFKYRYYFNNHLHLLVGLNLTHASNGANKLPNLGVNLVEPVLGLGFDTGWEVPTRSDSISYDKKWKYSIQIGFSAQEVYPIGGPLYPLGSISFVVRKRFTNISGLQLNADGFYKTATLHSDKYDGKSPLNILQGGVFAGYNLYLNKVRLTLGIGGYVYDKYRLDPNFYARLSMEYLIGKHFSVLLGIKSHWAKADYVEYGVSYTF